MAERLLNLTDICAASGASPVQIEFWCKRNILIPAHDSRGRGNARAYDIVNVLEATQFVELTRANFTSRQLHRLAATQRAVRAPLTPAARIVETFKAYIATVEMLAHLFGKGDGYGEWQAAQMRELRRLEQDLTRRGKDATADALGRLVVAARERETAVPLAH